MNIRGRPVGYLFTDIEGSTQRWEKLPARMRFAIERHDRILDEVIGGHGGCIRDHAGDGVFATFDAGNPLQCALDIQLALQKEDWSAVDGLLVRIGLHAGMIGDHEGTRDQVSVNRAARIMSSGWGGQIVVSDAAIKAYPLPGGCQLNDLGICRLRGVDEPLRLFGLAHGDLTRTEFPPLRSLSIHSLSLPAQSTPFIGRTRELNEIIQTLASQKTRLLCILSPGGNGKSRLAAQVAGRFSKYHPVHFVSLDAVTSKEELVSAIGATMRFPFHGPTPPEDQLIDYLRDKQVLLVLDNFDGLVSERAVVVRLLNSCASLAILTTSREALRIQGEIDYRLSGFALPGESPHDVRASSAYQLFVQEARTTDPQFDLVDGDLGTFREVCRVLGGSPLALHLTAQWTHLLSLEAVLAKLRQGLGFLNEEAADVPERHRSLGSAFEGSWALLTGEQRKGLARLSVFPSDFESDAAERVSALGLKTLAALEKRTLVERSSQRRLALHPIIREFARAKLLENRIEETATLERYSRHYLELVCSVSSPSTKREQCLVFDQFQQEIANLREAWNIAIRRGATELIYLAIEPLFYFLTFRALYRDAGAFFDVKTADRGLNIYLTSVLANCFVQQGDFTRAEAAASLVLEGLDIPGIAQAHAQQALGNLAHARGELQTAKKHYEDALATRTRLDDSMGCYFSTMSLAALYLLLGDTDSAREKVKQSARLSKEEANTNGMMVAYFLAGDIALHEKRSADARASYANSLRVEETVHNPQFRASILLRLGSVLAAMGDGAGALERHGEAFDLATDVGDQRLMTHALLEIGCDQALIGEVAHARHFLLRGVRIGRQLGARPLILRGVLELASIELRLGHKERAKRLAGSLDTTELGALRSSYETLVNQLAEELVPQSAGKALDAELDEIFREDELSSLRL
jgi:predicted ATPase/class 3 adenylate cyclase